MKHLLTFILLLLSCVLTVAAQERNIHPVSYIFNPNADAKQDINDALQKAAQERKHICVAVGGDWSFWSRELINFFKMPEVKKYTDARYIIVRVNFSQENRNADVLSSYSCPGNSGYPIIMILDEKGHTVHMQDLDEYKVFNKWHTGYDDKALLGSLKVWAEFTQSQPPANNK